MVMISLSALLYLPQGTILLTTRTRLIFMCCPLQFLVFLLPQTKIIRNRAIAFWRTHACNYISWQFHHGAPFWLLCSAGWTIFYIFKHSFYQRSVGCSSNYSPSSSTTKPTGAIIGGVTGVIGRLILISFLLALFFFNRRRNNRSEKLSTVPSPDVVNPFTSPSSNPNSTMTFLLQNYASNGQSLLSQSMSSKFSQRGQPSDPASTGTSSGGGIPPFTPFRPQFSSPPFAPSGSSRISSPGSPSY